MAGGLGSTGMEGWRCDSWGAYAAGRWGGELRLGKARGGLDGRAKETGEAHAGQGGHCTANTFARGELGVHLQSAQQGGGSHVSLWGPGVLGLGW